MGPPAVKRDPIVLEEAICEATAGGGWGGLREEPFMELLQEKKKKKDGEAVIKKWLIYGGEQHMGAL